MIVLVVVAGPVGIMQVGVVLLIVVVLVAILAVIFLIIVLLVGIVPVGFGLLDTILVQVLAHLVARLVVALPSSSISDCCVVLRTACVSISLSRIGLPLVTELATYPIVLSTSNRSGIQIISVVSRGIVCLKACNFHGHRPTAISTSFLLTIPFRSSPATGMETIPPPGVGRLVAHDDTRLGSNTRDRGLPASPLIPLSPAASRKSLLMERGG